MTELQQPDSAVTQWKMGNSDNVEALTPPSNQVNKFNYNTETKLLTSIDAPEILKANAGDVSFAYNEYDQLTKISRSDDRSIGFTYDSLGRLKNQQLSKGSISYGYTKGHLSSVNRSDMYVNLSMTRDGSQLTGSTWSDGVTGKVTATHDKNLWLSSLTVNDASTVNFTYWGDGLLLGASATAGAMTFARDAATGRVTGTALATVSTANGYNDFGDLDSLSAAPTGTADGNFAKLRFSPASRTSNPRCRQRECDPSRARALRPWLFGGVRW